MSHSIAGNDQAMRIGASEDPSTTGQERGKSNIVLVWEEGMYKY